MENQMLNSRLENVTKICVRKFSDRLFDNKICSQADRYYSVNTAR